MKQFALGVTLLVTLLGSRCVNSQSLSRVSVSSNLAQANGDSEGGSISADGRYVSFHSSAGNLVPNDQLGFTDVFVYDVLGGTCVRASVTPSGGEAHGNSYASSLSADGHYLAFESTAGDLTVSGGSFGNTTLYLRDMVAGTTSRIDVTPAGTLGNSASYGPSISADGRSVAFYSLSSNLVAGDTNGVYDVFVRDVTLGITVRVSTDSQGSQGTGASWSPSLSADGRLVAFQSEASNLVAGDTNGATDVFVRDVQSSTTISVTADPNWIIGNQASYTPSISADGRFVAFASSASNLVAGDSNGVGDVFVYDMQSGYTARASLDSFGAQVQGSSSRPSISGDGRYVVFESDAANLVVGDTNGHPDVFLHDTQTGTTIRANYVGVESNAPSSLPFISADGSRIFFSSDATNLVTGDTNGVADAFVFDQFPNCGSYITYCTAKTNSHGCVPWICAAGTPSVSGPNDFYVTATRVLNNKTGLLLWSLGQSGIPFHGGTLCLASPLKRTPAQNSGGTIGINDCTGSYSYFFDQGYMAAQNLTAGTTLYAQYWSRDPFLAPPDNIGLTNALQVVVLP